MLFRPLDLDTFTISIRLLFALMSTTTLYASTEFNMR